MWCFSARFVICSGFSGNQAPFSELLVLIMRALCFLEICVVVSRAEQVLCTWNAPLLMQPTPGRMGTCMVHREEGSASCFSRAVWRSTRAILFPVVLFYYPGKVKVFYADITAFAHTCHMPLGMGHMSPSDPRK